MPNYLLKEYKIILRRTLSFAFVLTFRSLILLLMQNVEMDRRIKAWQGNEKKKRPVRSSCQKKKNYEDNRRTRKFIPQWKKDRPWLTFCEETNLMFCTYCKDNGKENIFVKGCNNFRRFCG